EIHRDMQVTIKQEQELTEENHELTDKKSKLIDPDELINRARKQFGLVKPGEIPYKQ
ncbi:MAG: septum formation initiator family protein, partial [Megasphaera micronuciformis]|nr:septum formation initiator family protein [Megasphaera micronuciformis]